MKKVLILLLLLVSIVGFGQDNIVKISLPGISYGDYSLSYERVLTQRNTINASVGFMAPKYGFFHPDSSFTLGGGIRFNKFKTGFHASVDYRFYVGKKEAPVGLYVAPYLRYFKYSLLLNDDIKQDLFNVNTSFSSIGAGFQLGYQWLIKDKVSIDFEFIGLGAEYLTTKLVYSLNTPRSGFDYDSIIDEMRDVFTGWTFFEKRLKTTSSTDNTTAKISTPFPGFKFGLTVGYAF